MQCYTVITITVNIIKVITTLHSSNYPIYMLCVLLISLFQSSFHNIFCDIWALFIQQLFNNF